jgi:AcrR family transcriptional regulator
MPTPPKRSEPNAEKLGRRHRRRAEIRERLYQSALQLFIAKGVEATRVKEITESADVGKGTFFNYFPTKEHVLALFYERQGARIEHEVQDVREGRASVRRALQDLVKRASIEASQSPTMVRSFLGAIVSKEVVRQSVGPQFELSRRRAAELFAVGQQRGEIRRDLPPSELARMSQALSFGTALFWSLRPESSLVELLKTNLTLFWLPRSGRKGADRPGRQRSPTHRFRRRGVS